MQKPISTVNYIVSKNCLLQLIWLFFDLKSSIDGVKLGCRD